MCLCVCDKSSIKVIYLLLGQAETDQLLVHTTSGELNNSFCECIIVLVFLVCVMLSLSAATDPDC